MLSGTVSPIDGFPVGRHPTVIQFLKGVYNLNPTKPKYCTVWDVSVVLKYIKSLPCNGNLSLKDLTYKLVILVALVSADRGQSIALLDLRLMSVLPSKVVFVIDKLTKTSKPDKPVKKLILPSYPKCEKLCVTSTLQAYIEKTKDLRNSSTLFISLHKPHRSVTSCTIARWIKHVLTTAGVHGFGAHSTRSASTSAALEAGLSVKDIMSVADWSHSSTFNKFYKRSIDDGSFGKLVLQKNSS